MSMSLRVLAVSAMFAFAGAAFAATPPAAATGSMKAHTPQQQRMIDCNKQATGKTGAERKTFMSGCLKGQAAAPATASAKTTQQEKMKSCNADAKSRMLKGAERKTFMSGCLKGGAAATP